MGGGLLPAVVPLRWARVFGRGPTVSGNPPQWGIGRDRVHVPLCCGQPGGATVRAQPSAPVAAVADPPLLTHVWRRFFEQRSRPGFRR
ncbi:multiple cyclophane-containing RiPP AmcA [Salinispora fenicalii]|uniref:multiple cyclophane-containing RiPP AmcA n=1 Tax=Salinispora fenicalii TaxID=1137263 RepID=UPI0037CC11D8